MSNGSETSNTNAIGSKAHKLAGRVIDSTTTNDVVMKIDFETSYILSYLRYEIKKVISRKRSNDWKP